MITHQPPSSRDQVIEAMAELASALDRKDWTALEATLTPDCEGYGVTGAAQVVEQVRDHLDGVGPTQHLLGNHRVALDSDREEARVRAYARVHHVGAGSQEGQFFECLGEYDDTWVLVDGAWRLRRRWFDLQISLGSFAVLKRGA